MIAQSFKALFRSLISGFSPPVQGVVTDPSPQTAAPSSQDASGQQPLPVENTGDHATAYSYQQTK